VDVIYGSLDKSSEYADFLVTKMDHDKTMLISVFNTPGGEQLRKMLDADTTGGLFRFAADITELVDIKVGFWTKVKCQLMRRPYPVSKKAAAFSRFYVVVEKQVQVSAPLTSSLIILP
jgi:hypothetical protein